MKNFEARNGNVETSAVVKNPRGQNSVDKEVLEIVGNGKLTGSVWKETVAVSPTRNEYAWRNDTIESISEFFHAAEWE